MVRNRAWEENIQNITNAKKTDTLDIARSPFNAHNLRPNAQKLNKIVKYSQPFSPHIANYDAKFKGDIYS